jgi:hypothetical protein
MHIQFLVLLVHKAFKVRKAHKVLLELAHKVLRVHKVLRDQLVLAQT